MLTAIDIMLLLAGSPLMGGAGEMPAEYHKSPRPLPAPVGGGMRNR